MLKLSRWTGAKLPESTTEWFSLFEELNSVDLNKVRLYDGSLWLPRTIGAITLSLPLVSWLFGSSRIYFNAYRRSGASTCDPSTVQGIELLAEALFHAKQQIELGATRIYVAYLSEYFRHRWGGLGKFAAYQTISFEKEAKAFAKKAAMQAAACAVKRGAA